MILVVGATGMVGGEVCRLLAEQGKQVRAMVRGTSAPERVSRLQGLGASVVQADLKDIESLNRACRGASVVITTASSTLSRQPGDSIATVDQEGQLSLIEAARRAGVGRFVLISFPPVDLSFPLQSAKRAVEDALRRSGMTYTILQPTFFLEVWLSPAMGFDLANGKAQIFGSGQNKISWISFRDVARFVVAALDTAEARNAVIELGGPDALSPLEVVKLAEQIAAKPLLVQPVPQDMLEAQYKTGADPMQKSFAALMLFAARGSVIDKAAAGALRVDHLKSVRDHLQTLVSAGTAA